MSISEPASAPHRTAAQPTLYTADYPTVPRCMAFVDISRFTSYANSNGSHAAACMVANFRSIVRTTTGRHSVRVARWLGDGVMLVGTRPTDVIEALCDIAAQCYADNIAVHCGLANGEVIIFEGDDYIGSIVNIASRLSHLAESSQLYCYNVPTRDIPEGLVWRPQPELTLRGTGPLEGVIYVELIR